MKSKLITIALLFFTTIGYSQILHNSSVGHTFFHKSSPFQSDGSNPPCETPEDGKVPIDVSLIISEEYKGMHSPALFFSAWNSDGEKVGSTTTKLGREFTWSEITASSFDLCSETYFIASGRLYIDVEGCNEDFDAMMQSFEFCYEIWENGEFTKITDENFSDYFDLDCFEAAHAHEHYLEQTSNPDGEHDYDDTSVPACANFDVNVCCEEETSVNQGSHTTGNGNGKDPDYWNDSDGDGVPDRIDNCPDEYNPGQEDSDQNGVGDRCDPNFGLFKGNTNGSESGTRNNHNSKKLHHFHSHNSKTFHIYSLEGKYLGHYHNLERFKNINGNLKLYIVVTTENNVKINTEKLILSFD